MIETIKVTKQFLDEELMKYEKWEDAKMPLIYKRLFNEEVNPKASFAQVKAKGIGAPTITNFLGKGWEKKKGAIDAALVTLRMIKNDEVSEEAVLIKRLICLKTQS